MIGSAGRTVHIASADDPAASAQTLSIGEDWHAYTVPVTPPAKPQAPLAIVLRVDQPPATNPLTAYVTATPEVGRIDATPRLSLDKLSAFSPAAFGCRLCSA